MVQGRAFSHQLVLNLPAEVASHDVLLLKKSCLFDHALYFSGGFRALVASHVVDCRGQSIQFEHFQIDFVVFHGYFLKFSDDSQLTG